MKSGSWVRLGCQWTYSRVTRQVILLAGDDQLKSSYDAPSAFLTPRGRTSCGVAEIPAATECVPNLLYYPGSAMGTPGNREGTLSPEDHAKP